MAGPAFPSEVDVAIVGGGAAGIGAGTRLRGAGVSFLILEARERLGGRAHSIDSGSGFPLDLGCHWLHSADVNPWTAIAEAGGFAIDRTPAPWSRRAPPLGFSRGDWRDYRRAADAFQARVSAAAVAGDRPAADLLEPGGRWNALIGAISTYANGVELERLSVRDYDRYFDNGVNWRLPAGYGTLIVAQAAGLPVALGCPVSRIDHGAGRIRLETGRGTLRAGRVIVTVPSALLAAGAIRFTPDLSGKRDAASGLPLGLADKVYLRLDGEDDLPEGARLFGDVNRVDTGSYHIRPLGRPVVEGYFGGALARSLESEGAGAFAAWAIDEIAAHLGSGMRRRLSPIAATAWARDPFALGSYSHALPGHAEDRAVLAAPVDDRLFFAGEACSAAGFSTAHGALETGMAAAGAALASMGRAAAPLKSSGGT